MTICTVMAMLARLARKSWMKWNALLSTTSWRGHLQQVPSSLSCWHYLLMPTMSVFACLLPHAATLPLSLSLSLALHLVQFLHCLSWYKLILSIYHFVCLYHLTFNQNWAYPRAEALSVKLPAIFPGIDKYSCQETLWNKSKLFTASCCCRRYRGGGLKLDTPLHCSCWWRPCLLPCRVTQRTQSAWALFMSQNSNLLIFNEKEVQCPP